MIATPTTIIDEGLVLDGPFGTSELDAWIGPEGMSWMRARELRQVLEHHALSAGTEISRVESAGAITFLAVDDLPVGEEGEPLDPRRVVLSGFRQPDRGRRGARRRSVRRRSDRDQPPRQRPGGTDQRVCGSPTARIRSS